jgi:hypothetical protein
MKIKKSVATILAAGLFFVAQARADSVISVLAETYGLQPATPDTWQLRYGTYWYLLEGRFLALQRHFPLAPTAELL